MDPYYTINGVGAAEPLASEPLRERIIKKEIKYNGIDSIHFDRYYKPDGDHKSTALAACNIAGHKVFLKAFWMDASGVEHLDYEHCVYDYMYHHGIKEGWMINFVPYVGTIYRTTRSLQDHLQNAEPGSAEAQFWSRLFELRKKELDSTFSEKDQARIMRLASEDAQVKILITEMMEDTITLKEFILQKEWAQSSSKVRKGIIAQIMFALYQMNTLKMQHNDLHIGNIMVQKRGAESGTMFYAADGREIMLGSDIPKIWVFDMDLATCMRCGPNDLDDFCERYGICNGLNPRFDIYTVLRYLEWYITTTNKNNNNKDDEEFIAFVKRAITKQERERFANRMCHAASEEDKCEAYPEGEPKTVMLPEVMIKDHYFDEVIM